MDIKNLRVGNWVEIIQPNKDVYTTIQPSCFTVEIEKFYKPIPLTEEWLLKFGFRTEESSCFELDDININTSRELMWVYTKCKNNIEIEMPEFVHQLQNLYFALTGKELAKV